MTKIGNKPINQLRQKKSPSKTHEPFIIHKKVILRHNSSASLNTLEQEEDEDEV